MTEEILVTHQLCPLCKAPSSAFFKEAYLSCSQCGGIFLSQHLLLGAAKEKARYETHNNDVHDAGFQKFVSPIVEAVLAKIPAGQRGLDFGSGPGPVVSCLLKEKGYDIVQYDPFFSDKPALLQQKYDFIVCCEVVEHFYFPEREFRLLRNLLVAGGRLFCMTLLYEQQIDFAKWFYKNDETHVFFYQASTFAWIAKHFGFSDLTINGRLIELKA